jgi:hypothetical protein
VCAAGLTVAWCVASFWFPFGWDQGMFATVGDAIVRGGMPYRDAWDMKGPLAYYGFALAQFLFGRHMWSIRILDLGLLFVGMAALAALVSRWALPRRGYWVASVFALWIGSLTWFHMVQPDTWAAILITLAAWRLVSGTSLREWMFSGAMIGCAALIKPLYLVFLILPLMQILEERRPGGLGPPDPKRWIRAAAIIGMALAPLALAVAWFAWRGALRDLIEVHILFTSYVYASGAPVRHWDVARRTVKFFLSDPVIFGLPVILAGAWSLWRNSRSSARMIFAWAILAVMCVAAQRRFFKYHWVVVFPAFLLLAAVGFDALRGFAFGKGAEWRARRLLSRIALALATVAVLRLAVVPASDVAQWMELETGHISLDQYYAAHVAGIYRPGDDLQAAAYIRERTGPADTVAVFGNDAGINFLSGRRNPTRFVFSLPLHQGARSSYRAAYRREYIQGLHRNHPAYFVIGVGWSDMTKDQALGDFPELQHFLADDYRLDTHIGGLDLYQWKALSRRISSAGNRTPASSAPDGR